jgi:rhodanese-related sulfurtransferase
MPVDAIEEHLDNLAQGASVLYCQSGLRSQRAWQVLTRRHGLTQVHNLGGMTRW